MYESPQPLSGFVPLKESPIDGGPSRECMHTHCNTMSRKIQDVIDFLVKPGYHKDEYLRMYAFLQGMQSALESLNAYEDQFE